MTENALITPLDYAEFILFYNMKSNKTSLSILMCKELIPLILPKSLIRTKPSLEVSLNPRDLIIAIVVGNC